MMRARSLLVAAFVLVPINTVLAADATDKPTDAPDCATLGATAAPGTATDRFMREWCQREDFRNALPLLLRGEDEQFQQHIRRIADEHGMPLIHPN